MSSFLTSMQTNPFLITAFIASIAASITGGVMGSYVVVKRIAFISGSISHAVLSGMGICLWLNRSHGVSWITPTHGALVAAVVSALLIGWIHLRFRQREDSVIAALWSVGMAVGVLFISQTRGNNGDLGDLLVGNILLVSPSDLVMLWVLDALLLVAVLLLHKKLLAICFDEEQARLQGLPVNALYLLLLTFIAISVVLLIQVVGVILVLTMLTLPPTIANLFTRRLSMMMVIAVMLNIAFCFSGIIAAHELNWPIGATIALITGLVYMTTLLIKKK